MNQEHLVYILLKKSSMGRLGEGRRDMLLDPYRDGLNRPLKIESLNKNKAGAM